MTDIRQRFIKAAEDRLGGEALPRDLAVIDAILPLVQEEMEATRQAWLKEAGYWRDKVAELEAERDSFKGACRYCNTPAVVCLTWRGQLKACCPDCQHYNK